MRDIYKARKAFGEKAFLYDNQAVFLEKFYQRKGITTNNI